MLYKRLEYDRLPKLSLNKLQFFVRDQIEKKIEVGEYQFERINCPICGSNKKTLVGEKDRYGLYFPTNICVECGLCYTNPRMNLKSYKSFYSFEYRPLYSGRQTVRPNFFHIQRNKGEKIYNFLSDNELIIKKNLFVLEVGCAAGGILDYFREKGHTVKGIDLGEQYVKHGKEKYNLDLEVGTLKDLSLDRKPDLIIYSHVLEHILDLNEELNLIKSIIHSNTIIYIEVPGIKEIHKTYNYDLLRYFQNAHTFHFSLESLTNLFHKHGFELLVGNQFIRSVFKLKKIQEVSLYNDYKALKNYLNFLEIGRVFNDGYLLFKMNSKIKFFKFLRIIKVHGITKRLYTYITGR